MQQYAVPYDIDHLFKKESSRNEHIYHLLEQNCIVSETGAEQPQVLETACLLYSLRFPGIFPVSPYNVTCSHIQQMCSLYEFIP